MEYVTKVRDIVKETKFKNKITNKDKYTKNLLKGFSTNYFKEIFNNSIIKLENLYVILYDKAVILFKN